MAHSDRGIRTPTSVARLSTLPALMQPLYQPEEYPLPRVPRQKPVDQLSSGPHDLARHLDESRAVRRELHPQELPLLFLVFGLVPRRYWYQQGAPGLEAPCQRSHHHVRPVADQIVHGRRQRPNAALELGDQVFLVATIIGREHNLLGRHRAVIGNVKQVSIFLEQPLLSLLDLDELADDDHPIALLAGVRFVVELRDHLFDQANVLVPSLSNDLLFEAFGFLTRSGFDLILWRPFQKAVCLGRELVGSVLETVGRLVPEDEADVTRGVPAVQMLGLSELGVSPHQDLAKAGLSAKLDGLIQVNIGQLLRRAIAAAIEQEQRLSRIGQRDQERMVAVLAVVGEVHSLFALGVTGHDGAIGVHDRLVEELGRLLRPDPQTDSIEDVHQGDDIGLGETAAEVPGGGRVGNSLGSQGVEVNLVITPQFEVLDSQAAGEDIEGDVQDVVGFVVRKVPLEQMKVAVDLLDELDSLGHLKNGADAAGAESPDTVGVFVVDIGRGHHGHGPLGPRGIVQPFLNSPPTFLENSLLACRRFISESSTHSKAPLFRNSEDVFSPTLFQKLAGFSSFFSDFTQVDHKSRLIRARLRPPGHAGQRKQSWPCVLERWQDRRGDRAA